MSCVRKNSRRLKRLRRRGIPIDGNYGVPAEIAEKYGLTILGWVDFSRMIARVDYREVYKMRGWVYP